MTLSTTRPTPADLVTNPVDVHLPVTLARAEHASERHHWHHVLYLDPAPGTTAHPSVHTCSTYDSHDVEPHVAQRWTRLAEIRDGVCDTTRLRSELIACIRTGAFADILAGQAPSASLQARSLAATTLTEVRARLATAAEFCDRYTDPRVLFDDQVDLDDAHADPADLRAALEVLDNAAEGLAEEAGSYVDDPTWRPRLQPHAVRAFLLRLWDRETKSC